MGVRSRRAHRPTSGQGARLSLSHPVARYREVGRLAILQGNLTAAEKAYAQAIALGSVDADVFNNLATIYDKWGVKSGEGVDLMVTANQLAPNDLEIRRNLLNCLARQIRSLEMEGRYREALPLHEKRVGLEKDSAPCHRELGSCYAKTGNLEEAAKHFTRAINLDPKNAGYYNDLGLICFEMRWLAEAQGAFQEVLRLNPDSVVAYVHLGLLANLTGLTGLAVSFLRRALEKDPKCSEAQNNLALLLRDQGELSACRHHYEEAIRLKPDNSNVFSGYLLSLNDDPSADPAWVASEHRRFQTLVASTPRCDFERDLNPNRRLRVGYLSPDFRVHSVSFFICPIFRQHDRNSVDTVCYSTGLIEDGMTERIKVLVGDYRNVYRMGDEDLAEMIRSDGVDVLVELSGHTADNRLSMLSRRVAPVQITYLGYPNTTGLNGMDYRIVDSITDPPGLTESRHSERLARVEGGFLSYDPLESARSLPVCEMPAVLANRVTFGSFNNLAKLNDLVVDTWSSILEQVPDAILLLKARGLRNEKVKERLWDGFTRRGIDADQRVRMAGHERSLEDHLRVYGQVDLALDTFPYNGTTTTCEALWMGTPVLTFEGACHAGRVGASLLTHAGLEELVAKDRNAYIDMAVAFGRDWSALRRVRAGLRERFASSPIMDGVRMARGLERIYRDAWQAYCARQSGIAR